MERRASCVMPLLLSLQAVAGIALYTAPNAYAAAHAVGQPAAPIYTAAALRHRAGALRCCEASDASAICAGRERLSSTLLCVRYATVRVGGSRPKAVYMAQRRW